MNDYYYCDEQCCDEQEEHFDDLDFNNDECEYFANGFIYDEKIFIQNYIFNTLFEIEFDFGKDPQPFMNASDEIFL